jgi:hypothetical protein
VERTTEGWIAWLTVGGSKKCGDHKGVGMQELRSKGVCGGPSMASHHRGFLDVGLKDS